MALRFFSTICLSIAAVTASAAMSILDIKHSITDPNVIAPESFETATRQLEEDFYLKYFTERVEMIDTWDMTRTVLLENASGKTKLTLPGKEGTAVLARKVD